MTQIEVTKRLRRVFTPAEQPQPRVNEWVIRGRAFAFDRRARTELTVSYGHVHEHTLRRAVSLRIDDRLIVLGADSINQLIFLLIDANAR